jgi:hypothetical protein
MRYEPDVFALYPPRGIPRVQATLSPGSGGDAQTAGRGGEAHTGAEPYGTGSRRARGAGAGGLLRLVDGEQRIRARGRENSAGTIEAVAVRIAYGVTWEYRCLRLSIILCCVMVGARLVG